MKHSTKTRSPKLSYNDYRAACNEVFSAKIMNPTIYYNPTDGFYVAPSRDLVPNSDTSLGLAFYVANTGDRSHTGSRREYRPIADAIREYHSPAFNPVRTTTGLETAYCQGSAADGSPCEMINHGDKCTRCGHQNKTVKFTQRLTLSDVIAGHKHNADRSDYDRQ